MTPSAQCREALAKGTAVREANAEVKRAVKASRTTLAQALGTDSAQSLQVWTLLLSVPKIGLVKATHAINRLGISPRKRVGSMSARQKAALVEWVEGR